MEVKIAEIITGDRHRKDLGDVRELAESIRDVGLLQPIGITSDMRLVFGGRRIEAHKLLGLDTIEARTIDIDHIVDGEFAENEIRKNFNVSERVSIADAVAAQLGNRMGRPAKKVETFPPFPKGKSRDIAAEKSGLGSGKNYQKARAIVSSGDPKLIRQVDAGDLTINQAFKRLNPHVSANTGEYEWYTPPDIVEAARLTLGTIDLDPATSDEAQKVVQATRYYTQQDDGLSKEWTGRVFLNPPYASGLVEKFIDKVTTSEIDSAVVVVNNATETRWFQQLATAASAMCFPSGRIRFYNPARELKSGPLQGQAIVYIGDHPQHFTAEFSQFGFCVEVES